MTRQLVPVLFEDHTLTQLRPLSWSQPTFETRVGMFNARERVALLMGRGLAAEGFLLGRSLFADLHQDPRFRTDLRVAMAQGQGSAGPQVWLNGRLVLSTDSLRKVLTAALDQYESGAGYPLLEDEYGPLLFVIDGEEGERVLSDWQAWEGKLSSLGALHRPDIQVPAWKPALSGGSWRALAVEDLLRPDSPIALEWIWDLVPATAHCIAEDLKSLGQGREYHRHPFGCAPLADQPAPRWTMAQKLLRQDAPTAGVTTHGEHQLWLGEGAVLHPGCHLDLTMGPIILERDVTVMPGSFLQGPLFVGACSVVKAGAHIYGESSFGLVNKLSGEIGESTFGDFANKQHDGFIGHGVLGSWINLGAMTTCSDLKNNYGDIRVDLGQGQVNSGRRFVGVLLGDHAKTAIGTLFNTGSCIGFATNIFGTGMPPKFVGNFKWGGAPDCPDYSVDRALETARIVMSRRGCRLDEAHEKMFLTLAGDSSD